MTDTPEYFYRFRSIENLIGKHQELANQEIFFASPESLNDPMEGFKDIYWQGDAIVWRNFFRNYLVCLERLCLLLQLVGEQEPLNETMIPITSNEDQLPTEEAKNLTKEVQREFFGKDVINQLIERIASRSKPIRRNELYFYLSNIHLLAIETILRIFEIKGLRPSSETNMPVKEMEEKLASVVKSVDLLEQFEKEDTSAPAEQFYEALRHTTDQLHLIGKANLPDQSEFSNRNFVIRDFPEKYLNSVEKLLYPEWYAACFMAECSNASVWGHYGDNHTGVCLKFKAVLSNEQPFISLHGINGWSGNGPMLGPRSHQFHKVRYESRFIEVDFFQSLGRLPIPILKKFWFTDEQGKRSECANAILSLPNDEWRNSYWLRFHEGITTKSKDWEYEKEYRLILSGSFIDFDEPSSRKLKYGFSDLDGIIFGIKTKMEDKLKIMKIIEGKCLSEGRKDFNFYQASYSHKKGCIGFSQMSLIKFAEQPSQ